MGKKNIIAATEKLKIPGVIVGVGSNDTIYAYCQTKSAAAKVPDEIDGFKIIKRVTGRVIPG